eukprot:scaffold17202_cov67-Phaeocystis_antarctica.AAC.3
MQERCDWCGALTRWGSRITLARSWQELFPQSSARASGERRSKPEVTLEFMAPSRPTRSAFASTAQRRRWFPHVRRSMSGQLHVALLCAAATRRSVNAPKNCRRSCHSMSGMPGRQ